MKFPWVSRIAFDFVHQSLLDERAMHAETRRAYTDLLAKYHALREKGLGHVEFVQVQAAETFGPRTRAALDAMGVGLPRDSRTAMEARAKEYVARKMDDKDIAALVLSGEPVRLT